MPPLHLAVTPRFACLTIAVVVSAVLALALVLMPEEGGWVAPLLVLALAFVGLGIRDLRQTQHAVLRNYPIAAHLRFLLEEIRPEMRQYFFEDEKHGTPFSRDKRAIVYQRAKMRARQAAVRHPVRGLSPTATNGCNHSMAPRAEHASHSACRRRPDCTAALRRLGLQYLGDELRRALAPTPSAR